MSMAVKFIDAAAFNLERSAINFFVLILEYSAENRQWVNMN